MTPLLRYRPVPSDVRSIQLLEIGEQLHEPRAVLPEQQLLGVILRKCQRKRQFVQITQHIYPPDG